MSTLRSKHPFARTGPALPALMIATILVLPAGPVAAGEPAADDETIVIGHGRDSLRLRLADGLLIIEAEEDGKNTTTEVDIAGMGRLVNASLDEALSNLDQVLANLGEMQFQMRLGEDNRLNLAYDDAEFELDLDQIMVQVADAVELGLAEIDVDRWSSRRPRGESTEDELRRELAELQREMKELRRELRRVNENRED